MSDIFTLFEASAAIYAADGNGDATGSALWIGECMQGIRIATDYEEMRRERHGARYAPVHHVDESHVISWDRWYSVSEDDGDLVSPELERGVLYVLVLVWHNEEREYWVKRVYRGVTVRSQPLESGDKDAMTDNKTLRAEYVLRQNGLNSRPDLTATIIGVLLWIVGGLSTIAYTYDWATETWESTGAVAAATVGLNEGAPPEAVPAGTDWYLAIGADPVLWLQDGVMTCGEIVALGDLTLYDGGVNRVALEFAGQTYAVIQEDGRVIVRNLIETTTRPSGGMDIVIRDNTEAWKASLVPGGIRCVNFSELG